jgi:hypothetical protein
VTLGGSQHGRRGPVQDRQHLFRLGLAKVLVPFQGIHLGGVHWDDRRIIVGIVMLPVALTGFGLARMPNCERWWLGAASVLVISSNRPATLVVAGARHPHARAPDGDLARRPNGIPLDQVGTMGEAGRGQHCPAHRRKSVRACFFAGAFSRRPRGWVIVASVRLGQSGHGAETATH